MGSGLQQPQAFHSLAQFTFPPPVPAPGQSNPSSFEPSGSFQTYYREESQTKHLDSRSQEPPASTFQSFEEQEVSTSMEDDDGNEAIPSMANGGAESVAVRSPLLQPASLPRPSLDKLVGACTADIYLKMREVQHNHRPRYQPDSPYVKYRRYLVDWIAETSEDLKLDCATVHVAAFYLDRVLLHVHDAATGRCQVPKHLWQLLAMVCLRVAGKFEEKEEDVTGDGSATLVLANGQRINAVEAFTRHLGDAAMSVTSAQIREWEVFVLEKLGWHLSTVTPVHCLSYFEGRGVVFQDDLWNGRAVIEKIPRYVKKYNDFFANLCLQDYFYAQYTPTHLAAAILYSSRHALTLAPLWRPELEALTGHTAEEVHEVFAHIWKFYADTFPTHARRTTNSPKGIADFDESR